MSAQDQLQDPTMQAVTALLLPDDKAYLKQQLKPVPAEHRLKMYRQYCEVWQHAAAAESCEIRRDNAGRRAANIWLRKNGLLWLAGELAELQPAEVAA